jgi:threonine/homoserine/homoserine lactone efflux protein
MVVGIVGGASLIAFGLLQTRNAMRRPVIIQPVRETSGRETALVLGAAMSGLNPYFILWWLTLGLGLVAQAMEFGALVGVVVMYFSHVWMDFGWYTGTAYLSGKGTTLLGGRGYKVIRLALAAFLVYFGVSFVLRATFQVNIFP